MTVPSPRLFDHFVLPVGELLDARARYETLGFTVAPSAIHPFGTENCCIFFEDETFIEPLGIAQRETCEAAALKGNQFVRNDQTYRFRVGEEGFSHLVIKSSDAKADHKRFTQLGLSGGKILNFGRSFKNAAGEKQRISFSLAFASDLRAPDAGFFACEPVLKSKGSRGVLLNHKNGVVRTKSVIMSEPNPSDFQYFLQDFLDQRETEASSFSFDIEAGNGTIQVLTPNALNTLYGLTHDSGRGLMLKALVLGVKALDETRALLKQNDIDHIDNGHNLVVKPALGQGAALIFEAV